MIISVGANRKSLQWKTRDVSWDYLVKRLSSTTYTSETMSQYNAMDKDRRINCKDIGGMVGGELDGPQRKDSSLLNRCILALDIDYGSANTWDDYEMLCDWECLMHTTHSHTPENPRYRMYFPLRRPVKKEEYAPMARMVASLIDIEQFDDTTYEASRLMFWPSTCKDGEFKVWHHEGKWIDPDEILGMYDDWQDESEWPVSSRMNQLVRKMRKDKQEDPRNKTGIVGAFCKVYDIYSAIDEYLSDVYAPTDERDRYTFINGHTSKGLKVFDDGLFAMSWHDTDPAHGRLCNAFDLVRIHKCPNSDDRKSFDEMTKMLQTDKKVAKAFDEIINGDAAFDDIVDIDELKRSDVDFTEMGNALKLNDKYRANMKFSDSLGWCVYDGLQWRADESLAMIHVLRQCDVLMENATNLLEKTKPDNVENMKKTEYPEDYQLALNYYAWAKQSRSYRNISHTLGLAKGMMHIADTNCFDSDPWALNTPAGLIDLKTGMMTEHEAWHMCTMCTSVSPDWDAPHDAWDAFLDRVTDGDKEFQAYLQEIAGMALVGAVFEENLVMVYGSGGNGKSTLFKIWQTLAGDYAGTIRNELLTGNKFGNEVYGMNTLRGKRLVITSEFEDSTQLSGALLKRLTSRDDISANVKFHEPITFTPTHTLVLHTNHLPRLRSIDYGTVRRIAVAPFNAVLGEGERKTNFAQTLIDEEGSAILAWMIDGSIRFYNNHMKIKKPAVVEKATKEYIEGEDRLASFVKEMCDVGEGKTCKTGDLFQAFKSWLDENGLHWAGGTPAFKREVEAKGYKTKHSNKGTVVVGLALKDEDDI